MTRSANAARPSLSIGCPNCPARFKVAIKFVGRKTKCPKCGGDIKILRQIPEESKQLTANRCNTFEKTASIQQGSASKSIRVIEARNTTESNNLVVPGMALFAIVVALVVVLCMILATDGDVSEQPVPKGGYIINTRQTSSVSRGTATSSITSPTAIPELHGKKSSESRLNNPESVIREPISLTTSGYFDFSDSPKSKDAKKRIGIVISVPSLRFIPSKQTFKELRNQSKEKVVSMVRDQWRFYQAERFKLVFTDGHSLVGKQMYGQNETGKWHMFSPKVSQKVAERYKDKQREDHAVIFEVDINSTTWPIKIQLDSDKPVLIPRTELKPNQTAMTVPDMSHLLSTPIHIPNIHLPKITIPPPNISLPKINFSSPSFTTTERSGRKSSASMRIDNHAKKRTRVLSPKSIEARANGLLRTAKNLLESKRDEAARRKLRQLLQVYPSAAAAIEARELLSQAE